MHDCEIMDFIHLKHVDPSLHQDHHAFFICWNI